MEANKLELVRLALAELGEVSPQELVDHITQKHGVKIDPRAIPILRASLRELEILEKARRAARTAVQQAAAGKAGRSGPAPPATEQVGPPPAPG